VAVKTEGPLSARTRGIAVVVWPMLSVLTIASLAASSIVRPAVMNNYRRHPVGVLVPIVVFGSLGAMIWAASKSKEKIAFLASGVYLTGMLVGAAFADRKSTRLNSSHVAISYAVFCSK